MTLMDKIIASPMFQNQVPTSALTADPVSSDKTESDMEEVENEKDQDFQVYESKKQRRQREQNGANKRHRNDTASTTSDNGRSSKHKKKTSSKPLPGGLAQTASLRNPDEEEAYATSSANPDPGNAGGYSGTSVEKENSTPEFKTPLRPPADGRRNDKGGNKNIKPITY